MVKSPTTQFIDQYNYVQHMLDEFMPKPDQDKKIQEGLDKLEDIFDTYDDYGGIDKKELRYDNKLMTFLAEYLPNIYSRVETPLYGGRSNRSKSSTRRKRRKSSTRRKRSKSSTHRKRTKSSTRRKKNV